MKHFSNKTPTSETPTNKNFLVNDYVCPVTYEQTDLVTCKSNCFGEGCSFINTCQAVKNYYLVRKKNVKTKKRKKEKKSLHEKK